MYHPPTPSSSCTIAPRVAASSCTADYLQRVKDLTTEVGEFVAIQNAQVLPVSAHTGSGLGDLRASLAIALSQQPPPSEHPLSVENKECSGSETSQRKDHSPLADPVDSSWAAAATDRLGTSVSMAAGSGEGVQGFEVVEAEAPGGAAAATVLDYTSSAKTGKVLVSVLELVVVAGAGAAVCRCPRCCSSCCWYIWKYDVIGFDVLTQRFVCLSRLMSLEGATCSSFAALDCNPLVYSHLCVSAVSFRPLPSFLAPFLFSIQALLFVFLTCPLPSDISTH